jgi:HD-GYP domain-containing protein (c-di-GMP phosphodiesterase class II)
LSSNSIFRGNHVGLLRNISKSAKSPASNILELLNNTLEAIGENLGTHHCIIYEANLSQGFIFLSGYNIESSNHANTLIKIMQKQAEDSLQYQKITFEAIEAFEIVYLIPLVSEKHTYILALSFHDELNTFEIEVLESLSTMLSATFDRFYLQQQISRQYFSTVKSLVVAIEAKDVYTQGHSQRVADYSKIIGQHLKLKDEEIKELEVTGLVHDIGKIGISDQLLTKPDRLTETEFDFMRQHPEIGSKILQPLHVSENIMLGTLLHHKRYDLSGYPLKADIDKLPLVPAIIGVADAYDAMTSERSYKKTITKQSAVEELKRFRGTQFHPGIVDIVEELISNNKL